MEEEPKYKVGQLVGLVAYKKDNTNFFITAVNSQTCTAGTQFSYIGRVYSDKGYMNKTEFSEIELCELE